MLPCASRFKNLRYVSYDNLPISSTSGPSTMTSTTVTEEKKPQTVPMDDDNDDAEDSDEVAPEIAATDG